MTNIEARAPRVTLGMPVFNSDPAFFERALSGVLAQTFGDFELIISDNASNATSEQLYRAAAARDQRIRYHRHARNQGAVSNFAFLVKEARGEYFAWVADDDERDPSWLDAGVRMLDARSDLVSAQYESILMDTDGNQIGLTEHDARNLMSDSPPARVWALRAKNYNFVTYGLHRTEMLRDLDLETTSIFWDVIQSTDIFLHGKVGTVGGRLFSYRVDVQKDTDAYRDYQHMGDAARGLRALKYTDSAFLFLSRVLSSRAKLDAKDRAASFAVLGAFLLGRGWFIYDEFYKTTTALRGAVTRGEYATAIALGVKATLLSPSYPWRRWRARR